MGLLDPPSLTKVQADRTYATVASSGLDSLSLSYDVVIYGATPAGVMAAVIVAKSGLRALLLSPNGRIGGIETAGLSRKDYQGINPDGALNSLTKAQRAREAAYYGTDLASYTFSGGSPMASEAKVSERLYRDLLKEHAVPVLYGWRVKTVLKPRLDIEAIVVENAQNTAQTKRIVGRIFIDKSYESDLMMRAGVTYTYGREAITKYNESLAGVRTLQNSPLLTNQPSPYLVDGNSASGLLPYIDAAALEAQGTADTRLQAFGHRLMMTNDPANMQVGYPEPVNYNPLWYELHGRSMALNPASFATIAKMYLAGVIPSFPTKFDFNNNGTGLSSDFIGGNAGFVVGGTPGTAPVDYAVRQSIVEMHCDYTLGLLKFLKADPRTPAALLAALNSYGFCKDEFTSDDYLGMVGPAYAARLRGTGMSPELYIRESARMVGDFVMTQAHVQNTTVVADPVAYGSYSIDSHFCSRRNFAGAAQSEGGMSVAPQGLFGMDYRVMLPRSYECGNLLVGCNGMSVSHVAYNAIRLEYVFQSMGEAAGWAAVLAIKGARRLHNIKGADIQPFVRDQKIIPTNIIYLSTSTGLNAPANATLTTSGTWNFGLKAVPDYIGGAEAQSSKWGYMSDGGGSSKGVSWVKIVPNQAVFPAGRYRLRANLPITSAAQGACTALIRASGVSYTVYPKLVNGRPFFVDLGIFTFAGDGADYVTLYNQGDPSTPGSGGGVFNAESIHLEPVS